ncbi:MAG: tetratricopeptide repeat protein [Alphaproteobacteria bacterium]|nr:tetratricopeptide repeat protein [Alphaproteobacteria bacterium]
MMIHKYGIVIGLVLATCNVTGLRAQDDVAKSTETVITTEAVWEEFESLYTAKQHAKAISLLEKHGQNAGFSTEDRARFLGWAAVSCARQDEDTCSSRNAQAAIDVDPVIGRYMITQMQGLKEGDLVPTESFLWLLENANNMIQWVDVRTIRGFFNELIKASRTADAKAMLENLLALNYSGANDGVTPEGLWTELARLKAKAGETEAAAKLLVSHMTHITLLTDIWQDVDFAPLWNTLEAEGLFNTDHMLAKQYEKAQGEAERARSLGWDAWAGHRLDLISTLRISGDLDAAGQLADQTLAVIPDHQMSVEYVGWIKNEVATILENQNKPEQAIAYMEAMVAVPEEEKQELVSHYINLSGMFWQYGRYADALNAAEDIVENYKDATTDYGRYWAESARVCAQTKMGRYFDANKHWKQLKETPDKNYAATTLMALCMDDMDYTADLYIKRLADETQRSSVLTALSHFKWIGPKTEIFRLRERLSTLLEREDIQAAVAKAGRLGDWPFPRNYGGQF